MWTLLALTVVVTAIQSLISPVAVSDVLSLSERLELSPSEEDVGAVLKVYNLVQEEVYNKSNNLYCIILVWIHYQHNLDTKDVMEKLFPKLGSTSLEWIADDLMPNVTLQKARSYVIENYENEGILTCYMVTPKMTSNSIQLRFKDAVTLVFAFSNATIAVVNEAVQEYSSASKEENITHCIINDREANVTIARVSFHGLKNEYHGKNKTWKYPIRRLQDFFSSKKNLRLKYLRSTRYCQPEEIGGFSWPKTLVGRQAVPSYPCVLTDGSTTQTRKCAGNFFQGVYWEDPKPPIDSTADCVRPTDREERIANLSERMYGAHSLEDLRMEVEQEPTLLAGEITYVSKALLRAAETVQESPEAPPPNLSSVLRILEAVLNSNPSAIEASDLTSGSSADILESTERLLMAAAHSVAEPIAFHHVSGFAIEPESDIRGFEGFLKVSDNDITRMGLMTWNASTGKVNNNATVAAILQQRTQESTGIIALVFNKNSLFKGIAEGNGKELHQAGPVVRFTLFNKNGTTTHSPVTILLLFPRGELGHAENGSCVSWKKMEGPRYRWTKEGCVSFQSEAVPSNMYGCICTHLTDFALLVSLPPNDPEGVLWLDDSSLRVIHVTCASISLTSLLLIFVYASICPKWCRDVYVKINLSLSASLALLLVSSLVEEARRLTCRDCGFSATCVAVGVVLHYSFLASFCWVTVFAIFLALRVNPSSIFGTRVTHLILKASTFAWGAPLVTVCVTLGVSTDIYTLRPGTALCFPDGVAFYAAVFIPASLAIITDACAFGIIVRTLFFYKSPSDIRHMNRKEILRRTLTVFFIFFLLGMQWAMGFLLESFKWHMTTYRVFRFILASTTVLQGTSQFFLLLACKRKNWIRLADRLSISYSKTRAYLSSLRRHRVTFWKMDGSVSVPFSSNPSGSSSVDALVHTRMATSSH